MSAYIYIYIHVCTYTYRTVNSIFLCDTRTARLFQKSAPKGPARPRPAPPTGIVTLLPPHHVHVYVYTLLLQALAK